MPVDETEVLVIGAGLAGLQCARELVAAGRDVLVWESEDEVGGRIRTDVIDGFRCDRGFQVLNPAYPAVRRYVDLEALDLHGFGAGVAVRGPRSVAVLAHPVREPSSVPTTLSSGLVGPLDLVRLARWAGPALRPRALIDAARTDDCTLAEGLDRAGVLGPVRRVIERFLAGVLLDDSATTSNAFALLLVRMFALGVPGVPAAGMQALPRQLAAALGERVQTGVRASAVLRDAGSFVARSAHRDVRARCVVVAADPVAGARLLGRPAPRMHGVLTDWYAVDDLPTPSPMLHVDGRPGPPGPVVNTAVMSVAAPSYAPPGRHLVQASALLAGERSTPSETDVRAHAGSILGADPSRWQLLVRHVVPHATPVQQPPLRTRRPVRRRDGLWWCGDHRDTASIQGALISGHRTAAAVLGQLGVEADAAGEREAR